MQSDQTSLKFEILVNSPATDRESIKTSSPVLKNTTLSLSPDILTSKSSSPLSTSKTNSICKKSDICSICKNKIVHKIHSFCETCVDELFVVCEDCIDENNNHDRTHKFVLCSPDNKIIKKIPSNEMLNKSKNNLEKTPDTLSSPRHALLKRELSKSSFRTNSIDDFESDPESSIQLVDDSVDDLCELEFKNIEKYNNNIINNDIGPIEKGRTKKRSCCKNLIAALKNAKEDLSIEDVIQRCCSDVNEIYLVLEELMLGKFHENFIDSIKKNLMNHIKILCINKNRLIDLNPCIFSLSQIVELNLEENLFKKIPEEIREMQNLETLNISSNNLVDLPYGLANLPNLKKLYANFNEFRQFPPVIMDIPNLEILHIQYNPEITSFPPKKKLDNMINLNICIDNFPELIEEWNKCYRKLTNITITWNNSYPNNIIDGLYLGGIQSTWNDYVYEYFNINAVFTIGRELEPLILANMTHKECILDDIDGAKMNFKILDEIHNCLQKGNRCIVHCFAGVSRSSTMVIAYLMKYKNMRLGEAYDLVKSKRYNIYPNDGFWKQLILLDQHLFPDAEIIDYTDWRIY